MVVKNYEELLKSVKKSQGFVKPWLFSLKRCNLLLFCIVF